MTFSPPVWPVWFAVVAWSLLAAEAAMLILRLSREHKATTAVGISAAALLAGPVLALLGFLVWVMAAGTRGSLHGKRDLWIGLRGSTIVLLALLIWRGGSGGAVLAIGVLCSFWFVRAYRRTTRPISPRAKAWLLAVRITVIALATLWVLQPTWEHTRQQRVASIVLLGVDRSASMNRRDVVSASVPGAPPVGRLAAVARALRARREAFQALHKQADLQWFAFDEAPTPLVKSSDGTPPASVWAGQAGLATAIGDSAQAVFDPLTAQGWDVAGIVLFTDGNDNLNRRISPEAFSARMGARGVPLYTVGVGSQTVTPSMRSLTVPSCGAPTTTPAFRTLTIKPVVEALGLAGRTIKVTCTFGETRIGQETRTLRDANANETFEFTHVPLKTGFHRLIVRAEVEGPPVAGLSGTHQSDMLVQVTDREIRVLYIEGTYRYETKYITSALGGFERMTLHRWILNQPLRPDAGSRLGDSLEDWLGYHAILLGDVPASSFTPKQLEILKTLVSEYGKGLAMIGGENSFARGGWGNTPLADVLPVDLAKSRGQIRRRIQPKPTPEGETSALMRIGSGDESPRKTWARLDPLLGANLLVGVKPAATVLAKTAAGEPMIVTQRYGKGRALAIAFDTTWRWVLSPKAQNTADRQKRFWRQVVLYLAAPKGNVWIHTDQTTYDLDALERGLLDVEASAGVEDPQGRPVQTNVSITLKDPAGQSRPIELPSDGVIRRGPLPTPRDVGIYTLTISTQVDGKTLQAQQQFQVARQDREAQRVLANFDLLRRMAKASQGRFVPLEKLTSLLTQLQRDVLPKQRTITTRNDMLGRWRWGILALLVALLCAEWILRKKRGLI